MVALAVERLGGLDLAYLNAGVATGCGVGEDFDLERYRRAMGVNLDGVVFGMHAVLPALRERGGGAIVATASLAGLTGVPLDPLYAANKHGVVGLVRSLGPALSAEGIRVNAVCPGFAESAIIAPFRDALIAGGRRDHPRRGRRRRRRRPVRRGHGGRVLVRPARPHRRLRLPPRARPAPGAGGMIDVDALSKRVVTVGPREEIEIEQPFTGGRSARVPTCAPEDVEAAIARAREAQARLGAHELRRARARSCCASTTSCSTARTRSSTCSSSSRARRAGTPSRRCSTSRSSPATTPTRPSGTCARSRRRGALPLLTAAYEHHHPLGVVGIIAPWNYPLTLSDHRRHARARGRQRAWCIKPDGQTPFIALWGVALLEEAGLPPGLVQVVTGAGLRARHAADRRRRLHDVHRQHRDRAHASPSRPAAT